MRQTQREPPAGWLEHSSRLASEGRPDELRAYAQTLPADRPLNADDELLLQIMLGVGYVNTDRFSEAAQVLRDAEPLLAAASPVRQARYHALAGWTARGLHDTERAIDEIVRALALVDGESSAGEDLSATLSNCGLTLARLQLFPLAVQTAARAIRVAAASGVPVAPREMHAGYAYLAWGIQLEHLGLVEQSRQRWADAIRHLDSALGTDELSPMFRPLGSAWRALCAARAGQVDEGRRALSEAERLAADVPSFATRRAAAQARASLLLAEGRLAEAREALLAMWEPAVAADQPLWIEDVAWQLGHVAAAAGDDAEALRWHREMHQRYGRAQYEAWLSRATAARLRVEQEALVRRARELESDALSDPLTGVPNRRAFDVNLRRLVAAAHLGGGPLTVAIVDIDHFKQVNDTHGHPVGDEVLRRVARILLDLVQDVDRCARYGGDELVVCLPVTGADAAPTLVRFTSAVAGHPWSEVAAGLAITVSTGLAELGLGDTAATLFWAADQSLLAAKRARASAAGHIPAARAASPDS